MTEIMRGLRSAMQKRKIAGVSYVVVDDDDESWECSSTDTEGIFLCGACSTGYVFPRLGDTCGRCGAEVVEVGGELDTKIQIENDLSRLWLEVAGRVETEILPEFLQHDGALLFVAGYLDALTSTGFLTADEYELWARRLGSCPGHDDDQTKCGYCGSLVAHPYSG